MGCSRARSSSTIASEKPRIATPRNFSPSQSCRLPQAAPHSVCAFSTIDWNTGARSPGELLMTCKHLGGRGLLLQSLAGLGDEPRVFHCDDCLRGEILQQRDLLVGERAHLATEDD